MSRRPQTLLDKIWDRHVVHQPGGQPDLLYIDLHLIHEVTSPQSFDGLRSSGRQVRRPDLTLATIDHAIPTTDRDLPIIDPLAARQVEALIQNCTDFGVPLIDLRDPRQGIVHVIGPEMGLSQPGMVILCGDSHTSTHGAFGAFAFGVGTSEVEHVLATQTVPQVKPQSMAVTVSGTLQPGVTPKDTVLALIGKIGIGGATGCAIEYCGSTIEAMSMEGRMTVCNMSIEAGARAGMIAPDETTFAYLEGRPFSPRGRWWDEALDAWRSLRSDRDATYAREVLMSVDDLAPQVSWGTNPGQTAAITGSVPDPDAFTDPLRRGAASRALRYMDLPPGTPMTDIPVDVVFIGSCTNGRIEDLREASDILRGEHVSSRVRAIAVPGSMAVKRQAESEGIDRTFTDAGFEWREPGCSMCLGMNPDQVAPGERCASTSNRNFEGRQGQGARTHLMSPASAAAAAIAGHLVDVRDWIAS